MTKSEAKKLVKKQRDLRWRDIKEILRLARRASPVNSNEWRQRSTINKSLTKGAMFNIFWHDVVDMDADAFVSRDIVGFVAENVIREFGAMSGYFPKMRVKRNLPEIYHEDPVEVEPPPF